MVAVSIHGLASSPHGTSATPDRNTASSQGALIENMDAIQGALGPKIGPAQAVGIIAIRNSSGPGSKFRQIGTGKGLIVTNPRLSAIQAGVSATITVTEISRELMAASGRVGLYPAARSAKG